MKIKMLKSTLVLLTVLGLTACGKTEQEVRHDEVVKAQALGCIDSDKAIAYEKDANMETKNLIDVCFEKERQRKAAVYKQEEAERQARLAVIQKEQQKLALEQQKLQMQQQYSRPVAPGEYQSRIGDKNCGFWNNLGQWEWYPNMSQCKEETDNYLAYSVFAGLIGAEVIDKMFDKKNYNKNTYKPIKVKDYYSQNGKVVGKNDYNRDYQTYNQRKQSTVTGYKKETQPVKKYDSNMFDKASQKSNDSTMGSSGSSKQLKEEKAKKYDSNMFDKSSQKSNDSTMSSSASSSKQLKEEKAKNYNSNVFGNTKPTEVKKTVEVKKEQPKKNYNSNLFGNSSSTNKSTNSSNKKSSSSSSKKSSSSSSKKSSSSSSKKSSSSSGKKPR